MRRRLFLLGAAATCLAAGRAGAAQAPDKERFAKLPTIVLEFWDKQGLFHVGMLDLVLQMPEGAKVPEKPTSVKIKQALNAMPYEDFAQGNPAPLIKTIALEVVKKQPGGDLVKEVLIGKLLFR